MTTRTWNGANGFFADFSDWTPAGVPAPGDLLTINGGRVDAIGRTLSGLTIALADQPDTTGNGFAVGSPSFVLNNSTVAADTTIRLGGGTPNPSNPTYTATLEADANTANFGTIKSVATQGYVHSILGSYLAIEVGADGGAAQFNNAGTLLAGSSSALVVEGLSSQANLINTGLIESGDFVKLDLDVIGTGRMVFDKPFPQSYVGPLAAATIETGGGVGTGQTIDFAAATGTNSHGTLVIDQLRNFHALIKDFTKSMPVFNLPSDRIELPGINVTSVSYQGDSTGGTLSLLTGTRQVGALRFAGSYTANSFVISNDFVASTTIQIA